MTSSFHTIISHLQWTKLANIITLWKTIIRLLVVYGSKRHETLLKMGSPSYLYTQEDITGCSLQNPTCLKTPDEVQKFMNMQIKWRYPHQSQTLFYKTNRNQIFEIILSSLTLHHFISTILIVEMKRTFHTHTTTHTDIQHVPRCIDIYKYFYAFLTHVLPFLYDEKHVFFCFFFGGGGGAAYQWWCHDFETRFALLALCSRISLVTVPPSQSANSAQLDVFFVVSLSKLLNKQASCRWFQTWHTCDVTVIHQQTCRCRKERHN